MAHPLRIHACCVLSSAGRTLAALLLAAIGLRGQELAIDLAPSAADDHPRRTLVIGLLGVGTQPDHHLFATVELDGERFLRASLGGWNQQERMQPSHIAKQRRTVELSDIRWTGAGGLSLGLVAELATPAQLGQQAVRERISVRLELSPAQRTDLPQVRTTTAIPPWRRSDRPLHGRLLLGRAAGRAELQLGDGEPALRDLDLVACGAWQAAFAAGAWFAEGDAPTTATLTDAGLHVAVELPRHATDAGEGGGVSRRLQPSASLEGRRAIRVRWSCAQTLPVAWELRLFQRGQGWYRSPALLAQQAGSHTLDIPLRLFAAEGGFDMDHWFNPEHLEGVGVGLRNGDGLGPVAITIGSLSLVPAASPPEAVTIALAPDTLWGRNGSTRIPDGLFGAHTVGAPEDEAVAAGQAGLGIRSLRPIVHGGYAGAPADRQEIRRLVPLFQAGIEVVETLTGAPLLSPAPWQVGEGGMVGELERWRAFGAALAGQQAQDPLPFQRVELWNEPFMWARYLNQRGAPSDPQQHGYLPGPMLSQGYVRLAGALIDAHREAGGSIRFIGPSSAHFDADGWRHLTGHVLPVVLGLGERLDAVSEHHYQERALRVAAAYEAFQALHVHATGRRLPIINTEANDLVDQPGAWAQDEHYHPGGVDRRRFAYQVADILAQVRFHNDHVVGRHIHALWRGRFAKRGEAMAYRWFRPFAGDLLATTSDHPDCWALAARQGDGGALALYNDGDRTLRCDVTGVAAWVASGELVAFEAATGLTASALALQAGPEGRLHLDLPPLGAAMLELRALPPVTQRLDRLVHYAHDGQQGGLWRLGPEQAIDLRCTASAPAQLRLTVSGALDGHLEAVLRRRDGSLLVLPITGLGLAPETILELPLPPDLDGSAFTVRSTAAAGRPVIIAAALVEMQRTVLDRPHP